MKIPCDVYTRRGIYVSMVKAGRQRRFPRVASIDISATFSIEELCGIALANACTARDLQIHAAIDVAVEFSQCIQDLDVALAGLWTHMRGDATPSRLHHFGRG